MGQKLHVIKKDKYRLIITTFEDPEYEKILKGESKFNYRFSLKEKLSKDALECFEADIINNTLGFSLYTKLNFGTYIYVIERIDAAKHLIEELAYGFLEVLPDV